MPSAKKNDGGRFCVRFLSPQRLLTRRAIIRLLRLLDQEGRCPSGPVTVVVAGTARMRGLNRRFHARDTATDVLAFDLGAPAPQGGRRADIVVNASRARAQARLRGIPAAEELARYVIHGVLHLCGHDDRAPAARNRMWRRQEELLALAVRKRLLHR
ncbi:MAG: rRNA maturation RNase YbeY [Deltaproteobacteria bacterium]